MALADELDDDALERLMAKTMDHSDDEDGGMSYGTNDGVLPPNLPKQAHNEEDETAEGPVLLGQAPTFVVNQAVTAPAPPPPAPSFKVNAPSFVVESRPEIFRSALLAREIDREEACQLHAELASFIGAHAETERATMEAEMQRLRAQLAMAQEEAAAEVAAEKAAAKAKIASAEARAAHAKAAADVAVANAKAETKAAEEARRQDAADARKAAALGSLEAQTYSPHRAGAAAEGEVEPVPAQVFDFSMEEEGGASPVAAEDEGAAAGAKMSGVGKVTKVLRSLSFGKRSRKKQ